VVAAADLDLPVLDYADAELRGERFHAVLGDLVRQHWLGRTDLGYVVLGREPVMELLRDRRLAFPAVQLLELQGITEGPVYDRTANGLMARTGDDHARLRRIVSPAFTPRATERLRPRLHTMLEELWSGIEGKGACDFVSDVATRLPSMVIAELLGLPGEAERLAKWSDDLQGIFEMDSASAEDRAELEAAYLEVYDYVARMLAERKARPGPDLISTFAALEQEGDRLTDDECVTLVCAVIAGGTDTTAAQLSHAMRLFVEHPEQWSLLGRSPELAQAATAEVLRFEPITPFTARLALEELELDGVSFPPGAVLFACAATANRDPDVFADPDRFDITAERGTAQLLTFGFGSHFCLGANLARAEIAETLAFLAPRMGSPAFDGDPVFGSPTGIYGMESLPLRFEAVPS
jgi:cytochrome P450